jgi:hypothetical protein
MEPNLSKSSYEWLSLWRHHKIDREKHSVTDARVKLILCDIMVALAALGKPNAVMSAEVLEEKNANLTGAGKKSQNGSMESNEHRRQLNEFNSMCPACLSSRVFFWPRARILCLESL